MIGASAQHLNKPDESFTGVVAPMPIRYGGHASYLIRTDRYEDVPAVIPSVVFYRQGNFNTVNAGFQYKSNTINLGLWYRGEGKQQDAIVVSVILDLFKNSDSYSKFRVGLSHDATTSKLNYTNTGGTTEGALVFETEFPGRTEAKYRRDREQNWMKCYKFY